MTERAECLYDSLWSGRLDFLRSVVASGETERTRAVNALLRQIDATIPVQKYLDDGGKPIEMPANAFGGNFSTYVGLHGDLAMSPTFLRGSLPADWILRTLAAEPFDYVCELGAGWGYNLFDLHDLGLDRRVGLFAGEYTDSGVAMIETLAALSPRLPLQAFHMDFTDPDPRAWPVPKTGRTLFFTNHAIEQVPAIGGAFIQGIAEAYPGCAVIHFEPIGHQIPEEQGSFRMKAQYEWFRKSNWNMDLYESIRKAQLLRKIDVAYLFVNYYGRDPQNLCSILRWQPR